MCKGAKSNSACVLEKLAGHCQGHGLQRRVDEHVRISFGFPSAVVNSTRKLRRRLLHECQPKDLRRGYKPQKIMRRETPGKIREKTIKGRTVRLTKKRRLETVGNRHCEVW